MKAIDLFCGLGGWTEGLLAEGYDVLGFDIERHEYGEHHYPAQIVIYDVRLIHGSWFKNADLIVASPPCQEFSYMAMPWSRAKAKAAAIRADVTGKEHARLTELFNACFRIQREACKAADRHIPLIVENVRGAQPWVGKAQGNFGSFYLWGDVPELPKAAKAQKFNPDGTSHPPGSWFAIADSKNRGANSGQKVPGFRFDGSGKSFQSASVEHTGVKVPAVEGRRTDLGKGVRFTSRDCGIEGIKNGNDWFGSGEKCSLQRKHGSKSSGRKFASAMIAKIPTVLSRHIAASFRK